MLLNSALTKGFWKVWVDNLEIHRRREAVGIDALELANLQVRAVEGLSILSFQGDKGRV